MACGSKIESIHSTRQNPFGRTSPNSDNLQKGKLKLNIELGKNVYETGGFDPALKQSLEDQMARLRVELYFRLKSIQCG
jgi:hypothetical protein